MKIAFLTNAGDRTNLEKFPRSIGYYIAKSFENHGVEVEIIPPAITYEFPHKLRQAWYRFVLDQRHSRQIDLSLLKREAKIRSKILEKSNADVVFSFAPFSLTFLETDKKLAYLVDICSSQLNYYSDYDKTSKLSIRNYEAIERICFEKVDAIFYSTEWARKSAIKYSNVNPNKVFVAPLGANLDINHNVEFIEQLIEKRLQNEVCKFLLIGTDWRYKGAGIAIEIVQRLNERGLKSELTVIGSAPDASYESPDFLNVIKFVDTGTEAGTELIKKHYSEAFLFIHPTLVETYGHVFCEANAFGLPVISHKTGGVPSVVLDGKNGQLFAVGEDIDNFCDYIINIYSDKDAYRELSLSSFNEYQTRLNWDYGTKIVYDKLKELT